MEVMRRSASHLVGMMQAKWMLDHHGLKYKVTKHTPGLGELWLRKKTGKKGGVMTTPVLFTPDGMPQFSIVSTQAHIRIRSQWSCSFQSLVVDLLKSASC